MVEYLMTFTSHLPKSEGTQPYRFYGGYASFVKMFASLMFTNWSGVDCVFQPETNLLELLGCSVGS